MDPDLLGSLIDRHAAALVLYARQWCAAPEDVVQVAFVKFAQQVNLPAQPIAWLYRAVRNGAISQYRSDRRRQKYENLAAEMVPLWFEPSEDPCGLDAATATTYLAELPLEQREAIVAHLWGGLTFEQIAELVDSSPATVWRRYNAGLAALRPEDDFTMSEPANEMNPLAESLRGLAPAAPAISRDRVLFEAGRASASSRWSWLWKAGTLLFAGTTLGLGYALIAWVPQTVIVEKERIVNVPSVGLNPAPEAAPRTGVPETPSPKGISPSSAVDPETVAMWKVRKEVLRWGPEMLPRSLPAPRQNGAGAKELDKWLGVPIGALTAPYTTPRFVPKSSQED